MVRDAKAHHGVDLGSVTDASDMARIHTDVLALSDTLWGIYNTKLKENGLVVQEDLDEALEESDIDDIRDTFVRAVRGFFPLVWTSYMLMQDIRSGDPNSQTETP